MSIEFYNEISKIRSVQCINVVMQKLESIHNTTDSLSPSNLSKFN